MSFTILFALLTLILLVVVFLVTYKMKGLKFALIVTGITFIVLAVMFMVLIGGLGQSGLVTVQRKKSVTSQ
ncbi:MAG: hypothetical protein JW963_09190 [Anaerolineales bacterium]|nr:hypothetical protein [Anaerolineales bacterium]